MRKITNRQKLLADAYLASPALSVSEAAENANYSSRQQADVTLKLPHVQQYIEQRMAELEKQALITHEEVINGLKKEATSFGDGSSHSARVSAWGLLGKHLGMFTEKHEVTGKDGAPFQPPVFNIVGVCSNGSGDSE